MNLQRFAFSSICMLGLSTAALAQQPPASPAQRQETTQNPIASGQVQVDQEEQRRQKPGQVGKSPAANADYMKTKEKLIAECIALANHEEVSLGKFAQERSQNSAVKEFAKMLVEDHQSMLDKLQSFAPEASKAGFLNESASKASDSNKRDATPRPNQDVKQGQETNRQVAGQRSETQQTQNRNESRRDVNQTGNSAPSQQGLVQDVSQLHRELAEQCLADSKSKLSEKEGSDFDECFVGTQIVKHASMLSNLTVFERHASGELKQIISQSVESTKKHLKHAENLIDQLDGNKSTSKSEREQDSK